MGLSISGLAYNPDTQHLFVMANAADTRIYVLDTANNFAPVGAFAVNSTAPQGAFGGAGLEMACDGSLWLTDQSDGQVFQVTSGETTTLCQVQAAWLTFNTDRGYLAAGEHIDVQVTYNAHSLSLGDYSAQIQVVENTPYTLPNLPVTMHVQAGSQFYLPCVIRAHP